MSGAVLHFTPRGELSAQENVRDFVAMCKASEVLGASSQWDKNVWAAGFRKGLNTRQRIVFSTAEAAAAALSTPTLPEPFLSFAKAVLVYLQSTRPVVSYGQRLAALRCLEAALRACGKDARPTAVNLEVLDAAVELAGKQLSDAVAYRVAGQLELIADLMRDKGFVSLSTRWVHGVKKPRDHGSRISKQAMQARQEKMPSAAAIRALGGIFQEAVGTADTLVSSFVAVMLCAPERVNEVVRLRRNCLVEGEGRFAGKLGIRWRGSKLAPDTTKWLPTQMTSIAREAIERLRRVTTSAQAIAAWYTEHPTTLYLHDGARHLGGQELLTAKELALVLWGDEERNNTASLWAKSSKLIPVRTGAERAFRWRFADVERAVLANLPPTFPHVPGDPELECRDALGLMHKDELHSRRSTWLCMFECIDQNHIGVRLGSREETGIQSIFTRYGYTEDDGSPINISTHAFRHYLNTLAQLGGLSNAEIAIFSGRKDEGQNRAYDHLTSDEAQAPIHAAQADGFMGGLVAVPMRDLVNRADFRGLGLPAAHTTNFGYCMHNFASEPCQMYRDCINCEEQECVKGEAHKEANLRKLKEETEYLLEQAKVALGEEEYGADLWVKHQTATLERVNKLLELMDDPKVPKGARIRLNVVNVPLIRDERVRAPALSDASPVEASV